MIRMIAVPVCSRRLRIRSRIWAWIVTSSAVVGSSAISSSGSQARAIAIITRWAMPPDISCGNAFSRRSGSGMPTIRSSSRARPRAGPRFMFAVDLEDLADLAADVPDRVQRRLRLLEDHADPVAAELAHLVGLELEQVPAVEQDLARLDLPGLADEAHDRERGHALAAARLADEAHDLAAVDVEVDPVDGPDDAVAGVERRPQALDLEERPLAALLARPARRRRDELLDDRSRSRLGPRVVAARRSRRSRLGGRRRHRFSRGSRASRRPSPSRLKPSTVSVIAMPGTRIRCGGVEQLAALEADHRAPLRRVERAGRRPRNDRAAISRTAPPIPSVPWTTSGRQRVRQDPPEEDPGRRFAERPRRRHVVDLADRQDRRAHDPGIDRDRTMPIASRALTGSARAR